MKQAIVDRRGFLRIAGAAGVAGSFALAGCSSAAMSGAGQGTQGIETITIAGLSPLSGAYAQTGIDTNMIGKLVADARGKLLGQTLNYTPVDTQGLVDEAQRVVTNAMQTKDVKYFFGVASSSVALSVGSIINTNGGVFLTSVGADEVTGSSCNRGMFRWSVPTYGAIRETVIPMLKEDPTLKRWYAITPNYVFGQSLLDNAKAVLPQYGAELVGNSFHSLDETQFSSYIANAVAAKPDVLLLLNFSAQNTNTLKEAISFGLKEKMKILSVWATGLDQFEALGAEATEGLYFGSQYWHEVDTPENKKFVKLVRDATGKPPNYPIAAGYAEINLLLDAINKAGSAEDPAKVIKALEGYEYAGLTGTEKIRADNHQVEKDYYFLKGKAKSQMKDEWDFVDVMSSGKSFLPVGQTGCKL